MKKAIFVVLAATVLLLSYARESLAWGHHFRHGPRVGVGVFVGTPFWGPPVFWRPYWYPPPPYYVYSPPVVVQQEPQVYVQPPPPPQQYWYYCEDPKGYYPYVPQCPKGWMKVVPPTTPPGQ